MLLYVGIKTLLFYENKKINKNGEHNFNILLIILCINITLKKVILVKQ